MTDLIATLPHLTTYALDQLPEPVVITEADLTREGGPRIIFVNDAMIQLTGYSRGEILGQSPRMFQGPETDREVASQIISELHACQRVKRKLLNYRKDGTAYWTEINISPVRNGAGAVIAFISIQYDLTEFQKVEDQHQRELRLISTGEKIARVGNLGLRHSRR
jgi:PAS domain S-box-containing protein